MPDDPSDTGEWDVITPAGDPNVILASELSVADAEFFVAARSFLPMLINELRSLQGP